MGHIQHFNIKDDFYSDFIVGDLSLSLKDPSEFWFIHQNVCLQFTLLTQILRQQQLIVSVPECCTQSAQYSNLAPRISKLNSKQNK